MSGSWGSGSQDPGPRVASPRVLRSDLRLCLKFNHKLAIDLNVKSFCKKLKAKLKALDRVVPYIVLEKNNLLIIILLIVITVVRALKIPT